MSISSEKQKASTAWLEDRLRELTPEQFNGADHISPLPDRHIPGCPDKRREFLYGGTRVYLVPGFRKTNPFLVNSLAFLAEKYPQQMDDAARAFGVEDCNCSAYKLSETPCVLIDKLPTVYPDGERTVFQLMADAIRQKLTTSAAEPVSTAASPASQPPKPQAIDSEKLIIKVRDALPKSKQESMKRRRLAVAWENARLQKEGKGYKERIAALTVFCKEAGHGKRCARTIQDDLRWVNIHPEALAQ